MEMVSKQIQERNGREEKRFLASSAAERRRLWLKIVGVSNAFVFLVKDLQHQLEEDNVLTAEKKSCAVIVRVLSKNRIERMEQKRLHILFVMGNFTLIFRRLVSWSVRSAFMLMRSMMHCTALYHTCHVVRCNI